MPVMFRRTPRLRRIPIDAGERAYAYAKACGIIGKSFTGQRIAALGNLNSLNELDRLVFPDDSRELPGRELLLDLEKRILARTIKHILAILNSYTKPPELLVRQLRSCEYADLKTCLHHISAGKPIPRTLCDIGHFRTINYNAYPDIAQMLAGTEYEFILERNIKDIKSPGYDLTPVEAELDLRYYTLLTQSLRLLKRSDRFYAGQILAEEISLRNCVWALRLRSYFGKTPGETGKFLMGLKLYKSKVLLDREARKMLRYPLDSRPAWNGWRWEKFLNPETPSVNGGTHWHVNPRHFQNAASRHIYELSLRYFHRLPFSVSSEFCFIKLKQFEEDLLTSVAEGLGLGMTGNDVYNLIEIQSSGASASGADKDYSRGLV